MPACIRFHVVYPLKAPPAPKVAPKRVPQEQRKCDVGVLIVDWTPEAVATLGKLLAAGYPWPGIAAKLGRSVRSCQAKAYRKRFAMAASADGRRKRKVV